MNEVIQDKNVVARKQHRCYGCLSAINIGDTYNCQTNVGDGIINKIRSCLKCADRFSALNWFELENFNEGDFKK